MADTEALREQTSGVDMGRDIFQCEAPKATMQAVRRVVPENTKPDDALDLCQAPRNEKQE